MYCLLMRQLLDVQLFQTVNFPYPVQLIQGKVRGITKIYI